MPKKLASKKPEKKKAASVSRFNILSRGAGVNSAIRETLTRDSRQLYRSQSGDPNRDRMIIPIPDFPLALALKSRGLMAGTLIDVVGPEGIGKTSLMFTMMGWFIRHNAPCWYGETENKPMMERRIERCMHGDRSIAENMRKSIFMEPVREIRECFERMSAWLRLIRDKSQPETYVPIEIPALLGVDTFSKLLSPGEARGFLQYQSLQADTPKKKGEETKEEKRKREKESTPNELGGGSNMEHSKLAHAMMRKLPHLLGYYNACLIFNRHQNDRVDMSGGGGSFIPADVAELFNTASNGGRGFKQSAALQIVIGRKGFEKATVNKQPMRVGVNVYANIIKNSFGPAGSLNYRLMTEPREDSEASQEMVLDMNADLAGALLSTGLVSISRPKKNDVTCRELGIANVSDRAFAEAFYGNQPFIDSLMQRLEFVGCESNIKFPEMNPAFFREIEAEAGGEGEPEAEPVTAPPPEDSPEAEPVTPT